MDTSMESTAEAPSVVHVVSALRSGGLERVLIDLVRGLDRRGWRQAVCLLHGRGEWCEQIPAAVPVIHLSAPANSLAALTRLARFVRTFEARIVHSLSFGVWGESAWVRAANPRVRHLHAFHGFFGTIPRRWQWLGRLFARATDTCYAVAETTADEAAQRFGIARRRIEVLANGVDVERFSPAEAFVGHRLDRPLTCIAIGSVKEVKRPDRFVEIAGSVRRDMRFVWVGDGPLRPVMIERVRARGLQGRVEFVGADQNVANRLRAADVFLLTSDQEAAPLAVLEAMAVGLPVVAPPVGKVGAWLEQSKGGILLASHAASDFANAVVRLSEDSDSRLKLGRAGREFVVRNHSMDWMIESYDRFFVKHGCGSASSGSEERVARATSAVVLGATA